MEGRWNTAPSTLVKNLERFQEYVIRISLVARLIESSLLRTLTSIHEFMKNLADITWGRRFIKKASIENALAEYSAQLEDAAQTFQVMS